MPALVLFGRRSRIGSDDFFCPALLQLIFQIPFVLTAVLFVSSYRRCSTMQLHNLSGFPFWFVLLAIPIHGFMMFMNVLELHVSSQGTIIRHESRVLMKPLIMVHFVWAVVMAAYGTVGLVFHYRGELCWPDSNFVLVIALGLLVNVLGMQVFACCIIGGTPVHRRRRLSSGNLRRDLSRNEELDLLHGIDDPNLPNSDLYIPHQEKWEQRCHQCCGCIQCFTCGLFGGGGTRTDAMSVVASVFARFFYGSPDLVFSDIIAGFILLGAVQYHETNTATEHLTMRELRASRHLLASASSTIDFDLVQMEEAMRPLDQTNEALDAAIVELAHYSKYAIGIYGWMLYVWSHPWRGGPQLLFSCMKRHRSYVHGDNWLHLHQAALQLETSSAADDIVYADFSNSVCKPAYCVMLDHEKQSVVVAIRGTLSLEDCLTDAIAYGYSMDEVATKYGCAGRGEFAHQGMLQCAEYIMDELTRLRVLDMLLNPDAMPLPEPLAVNECYPGTYASYSLVVTGHSLGAAAAALLAIFLKPKYPRVRCLAFSPPGCLMSPSLAQASSTFITSVVLGKDIIARASLLSMQDLRDEVLELIGRSKVSKAAIMRQALSWKNPRDLLHAADDVATSSFTTQLTNYKSMLQQIQDHEPIHEMWLPGRVVHLKRQVRSQKRGFCMCCRPGTGICCTDRSDYDYGWSDATQFLKIYVSRTMLDDHFPDKVHAVLQDLAKTKRA
ncbi:hypothetical protein SDRG_10125 [Saprolegnia diclina VS20]|uniref:sn-1-specific diacylglycerol lipase n=1 Tax=Saprolegnia diclina (strain VS20) TaxID=1156394 RepID=T0Q3G8_SAPDV|nr:hypothetical protein SDRG_10125 [Saprolegnia diclina VS20]EQC32379.1 hypothetical protein SDRG_10125 [Saprolegnia diclina VS20]|eukprot:XP_008614320.1 hypothetical protein SDRG_10125 [Saprolegnia diclina VS20]